MLLNLFISAFEEGGMLENDEVEFPTLFVCLSVWMFVCCFFVVVCLFVCFLLVNLCYFIITLHTKPPIESELPKVFKLPSGIYRISNFILYITLF